jgi:hypothetical protein
MCLNAPLINLNYRPQRLLLPTFRFLVGSIIHASEVSLLLLVPTSNRSTCTAAASVARRPSFVSSGIAFSYPAAEYEDLGWKQWERLPSVWVDGYVT